MNTPADIFGHVTDAAASVGGRELHSGRAADVDAPSSNRASIKCNDNIFTPLLQGIDSLELSILGRTRPTIEAELIERKKLAQDRDPRKQAEAQIKIAGHLFEVSDKGSRRYPFVIINQHFYIKVLSCSGSSLPFIYAQVRSEYLWHVGPEAVRDEFLALAHCLGEVQSEEIVSRVDPFVDFRTSANVEAILRTDWITRASYKQSHSVNDIFTGWSVGIKSPTSGRLYNKPVEIETVSKKSYLYELWAKRDYMPGDAVWRLEFQVRREILKSLGLSNLRSLLDAQRGLWAYLTKTFLRLAQPNPADGTRSRWLNHPLWDAVSALEWTGHVPELSRHYKPAGVPSDKWLGRSASVPLASIMAKYNLPDLKSGYQKMYELVIAYWDERAEFEGIGGLELLRERVHIKGKQFGTMNNIVVSDDAAREYRRASGG